MATCKKCTGNGLVGQGPTPHKREGRTEVCPDCNGTGKEPETVQASEKSGEEGVDNSEDDPAPKRGILSRIFSRKS